MSAPRRRLRRPKVPRNRNGSNWSSRDQELVVAGGVGSANLSARQGLPFFRRRKCPRVESKQPPRWERPVAVRLSSKRMKTAKERPRDGISQPGGGGRAGPALRLRVGRAPPHGARRTSPGGFTDGGRRVRGSVIARRHLSRWGRLGRGYSGTDGSTPMVDVFVRSRDDGRWLG